MRYSNILLVATLLACYSANAVAADYVVMHIQVDPSWDNSHALFVPDDPRLLGRVFNIRPESISSDLDNDSCARVSPDTTTTLGAWLTRLFPAPGQAMSGRGAVPRQPHDFGLGEPANFNAVATRYRCDDSDPAARVPQSFSLPGNRLALAWAEDSVLLLLEPLSVRQKPQPSFSCADATREAEKTICSSVSLANWDRSIAREFDAVKAAADYMVDGKPQGDKAQLVAEQKEWLSKRDRCLADASCLLEAYQQRMQELALDKTNRGNVATDSDRAAVNKDTQWYLQQRHGH